jgi:hypothetical protein
MIQRRKKKRVIFREKGCGKASISFMGYGFWMCTANQMV